MDESLVIFIRRSWIDALIYDSRIQQKLVCLLISFPEVALIFDSLVLLRSWRFCAAFHFQKFNTMLLLKLDVEFLHI